MTDLEINRLCAEAMGIDLEAEADRADARQGKWLHGYEKPLYNPLHDDAQAMALDEVIFKAGFGMSFSPKHVCVYPMNTTIEFYRMNADMTNAENRRRWRCECVAKMQQARKP